jgi:serine/threonine-protein kinase
MKPNDPTPEHDPFLAAMYDLAGNLDSLSEDEINPSFASVAHEPERYKILEEIASGGMKHIYRAFDKYTHRDVAMARLSPDAPTDRFDPFIHEAWITAQLDHPNIIKVHDLGITAEGRPFFTMDLKTGSSLRQIIDEENAAFQPLETFIKICEAVAFAHAKGILHLDLKPSNIQIGRYGGVVVCDWGLAKTITSDETVAQEMDAWDLDSDLKITATLHGQIKGTPGYMAPEQIISGSLKTRQTDIYGLGCILFFLLTKESPLGGTHQEIISQTLAGALPENILPRSAKIPKPLQSVIARCTARHPEVRYASAEQLIDDIRKYQSGYSPDAEKTTVATEAMLFYRRNRTLCNVVMTATLLLILSTGIFIQRIQEGRQNERAARLNAQQALALYDEEHTALHELNQTYSTEKYELSLKLSNEYFFVRPVEAVAQALSEIKTGLAVDPENEQLINQKLYFHFLSLNFKTARRFANRNAGKIDLTDMLDIINKKPLIDGSKERPSIDEFIAVIQKMESNARASKRKPLVKKMLTYDHAVRKDQTHYDRLIREVLHYYNPKWDQENFQYDPQTQHLALHGNELKTLAYSWTGENPSLLTFLPITRLDISNSGAFSLTHLYGLNLKELDIRNTLISDLSVINQFPGLHRLIISPNQFTAEQLNDLPDSIQLKTY